MSLPAYDSFALEVARRSVKPYFQHGPGAANATRLAHVTTLSG